MLGCYDEYTNEEQEKMFLKSKEIFAKSGKESRFLRLFGAIL